MEPRAHSFVAIPSKRWKEVKEELDSVSIMLLSTLGPTKFLVCFCLFSFHVLLSFFLGQGCFFEQETQTGHRKPSHMLLQRRKAFLLLHSYSVRTFEGAQSSSRPFLRFPASFGGWRSSPSAARLLVEGEKGESAFYPTKRKRSVIF